MKVEIAGTHQERIAWIKQAPNLVEGIYDGVHFLHNIAQSLFFNEEPKDFPDLSQIHKLGLLFEDYLLGMTSPGTLKYYRQQVVENGLTLGEVDFVFENPMELAHVEVAIKFYMQYTQGDQLHFYGPNAKDQLTLKLQKLTNHQCRLLEDGRYKLLSLDKTPNKYCLLKGFLFHRPDEKPCPPTYINETASWGWWIYQREVELIRNYADGFVPVHKFDWMLDNYSNPQPLSGIPQHLTPTTPFMIHVGKRNQLVNKVMVLPNDWPKLP